jgi:hypothetical protein
MHDANVAHCPHHSDAFSNPRVMRIVDQNVKQLFLCTARSKPAGDHAAKRHLKTLETGTPSRSKAAPDHAAIRHLVTA